MLPLTLYVHLPWCVRKCPYCDFNSHAVKGDVPEEDYIRALLEDLQQDLELVDGRSLDAVFIGGGTPSLFSPAAIERLVHGVSKCLPLAEHAEITMEANPGAVDYNNFSGYRAAGVNRLSVGAQSFDDVMLKRLGRIHSGAEILQAFRHARSAGFENVNLDLMFGLPGQTEEQALEDLRLGLNLEPEHLSWYQLTIEPNTLFQHQPPPNLPDDDRLWETQESGQQLLAGEGYSQYEVSAYARDGFRCQHNLNYWQFGDYLGVGAGAHSKVTSDKGVLRRSKERQPARYMKNSKTSAVIATEKWLKPRDLQLEFMLNAMRLKEGVPTYLYGERTGLQESSLADIVERAQEKELMERCDRWLKPTPMGHNFLNDLLALFQ